MSEKRLEVRLVDGKNRPINRVIEKVSTWCILEIIKDLHVKVDLSDLELVQSVIWRKRNRECGVMLMNSSRIDGVTSNYTLQRFLLSSDQAITSEMSAAFRDRSERLDFRRSNLEIATNQLKSLRVGKRRSQTTSSYRGVSWSTAEQKWHVSICANQHRMAIGLFDSEIEAALAYNEASRRFFGENGFQNEIIISENIHSLNRLADKSLNIACGTFY